MIIDLFLTVVLIFSPVQYIVFKKINFYGRTTVERIFLLYLNFQSLQSFFFLRMDQLKCIILLDTKGETQITRMNKKGLIALSDRVLPQTQELAFHLT